MGPKGGPMSEVSLYLYTFWHFRDMHYLYHALQSELKSVENCDLVLQILIHCRQL